MVSVTFSLWKLTYQQRIPRTIRLVNLKAENTYFCAITASYINRAFRKFRPLSLAIRW